MAQGHAEARRRGTNWFDKVVLQCVANALNGLQDSAIAMANGVKHTTPVGQVANNLGLPDLPSPDWSRGIAMKEAGEPGSWSDTHGWSKWLFAFGIETLAGVSWSKWFRGAGVVDDTARPRPERKETGHG